MRTDLTCQWKSGVGYSALGLVSKSLRPLHVKAIRRDDLNTQEFVVDRNCTIVFMSASSKVDVDG